MQSHFLKMFLPVPVIYYDSHHLDRKFSGVCHRVASSNLPVLRRPSGCANDLLRKYSAEYDRKNGFLGRLIDSIRISLPNVLSFNFKDLADATAHLPNGD